MRRISQFAIVIGLTLVASGCGRREVPPPRPAPSRPPVIVTPATSADYVATAASIDLFVVQASELVIARSSNAANRDLATMLAEGHRGLAAQLSFAGRRLNLLPRATLLSAHQEMLAELERAGDVDATYRRLMAAVHDSAVRLHSAYAASGDSPTLRPVAANAAAVLRAHRDRL